jgi:hypothetical protein
MHMWIESAGKRKGRMVTFLLVSGEARFTFCQNENQNVSITFNISRAQRNIGFYLPKSSPASTIFTSRLLRM